MRAKTSGEFRRLNLTPVVRLLGALRAEWASLTFEPDGRATNPLTGAPSSVITLVEGQHRSPGATYRFEADERLVATLSQDDTQVLAFSLADGSAFETADVVVHHDRLPRVEVSARVLLPPLLSQRGLPWWWALAVGRVVQVDAVIDPGALDHGGRLLEGRGTSNRSRSWAHVDIEAGSGPWRVESRAKLRPRAFTWPLMLLIGPRIGMWLDGRALAFWATNEHRMNRLEVDLELLRDDMAGARGAATHVRRHLWDDTYIPGI